MKALMQVGLCRLGDPRVIRIVLICLILTMMLMALTVSVYACPIGSNAGCGGT